MTDNFFKGCPPVMSDGRLFTDYRTAVRTDQNIKRINGIERDDEYRIFLQSNAQQIMNSDWDNMRKNKSCWVNKCVHNYPTRMYPSWFVEQKNAVDKAYNNQHSTEYQCLKFNDYRASGTKSSHN